MPKLTGIPVLAVMWALCAPVADAGWTETESYRAAPVKAVQIAEWQKTKRNVKHSSKKAGREVGKGATHFGKGVAKGAKTVGKETRRVGRSIKKGIKDIFK